MSETTNKLIERLPEPEEVRRRLSECVREAAVLRSLLRISLKTKSGRDDRQQCREVTANG